MPKRIAIVTVALLGLMGATARLEAGAYYVSPSGSAAWPACANIATPCTPVAAFQNAQAGDTVYFRGGTYNQTAIYGDGSTFPKTPYSPAHSGTASAWITFAASPGETPIINGYVPLTPDGTNFALLEAPGVVYPANQSICMSAWSQSYIIFDGFTVQANGGNSLGVGKILVSGSSHITLRNMRFSGGSLLPTLSSGAYDNTECLRIESSGYVTVSNSRFVGPRIAVYGGTENHNVSSIKTYHNSSDSAWSPPAYGFNVYENCEFSNTTVAIFIKSSETDFTIRKNYIHDGYQGVYITPQNTTSKYWTNRATITNNVIANLTYDAFNDEPQNALSPGNDFVLANNTVYGTRLLLSYSDTGHGTQVYNNIVVLPNGRSMASYTSANIRLNPSTGAKLASADHNQWGPVMLLWAGGNKYQLVASWQASTVLDGGGNPGAGDLASDPQFVNASGTLTQLSDFTLKTTSPCKGAGRNGADMGADIANVGYHDPAGTVASPGVPTMR